MHYVCILRDTAKGRNTVELAATLRGVEKRIAAENLRRKLHEKRGELLLIYFECLKGPAEAGRRKAYLQSREGVREAGKWNGRWEKTEVLD